jgi:hypothetical protein
LSVTYDSSEPAFTSGCTYGGIDGRRYRIEAIFTNYMAVVTESGEVLDYSLVGRCYKNAEFNLVLG